WYVAPTIVNTFLEAYDSIGKRMVLFATPGGSGFVNPERELQPFAPVAVTTEAGLLNRGTNQKIREGENSL
ncbi:flavodoxin, partial [Anaerobutyricum hallii]|uniref:flavodoxin n=1 Tax=Anaerobutyricum hallii TaxID=39488 RepID=UPI0024763396